ncbi:hypothetical protein L218DRAFT_992292 [Marasmius fiardii PR-910]|nr:hypothetical protein L218DRAFT_992292 [Marasmius fiardii PR-910]
MDDGANDVERHLAPFLTAEQVITLTLSTLSVMFAIYGIYAMVFGLAIRVLFRRDGPSSRLYMGWSISLFVLATLYTATYTWGLSRQTMSNFKAATTKNYTPLLKYLDSDEEKNIWFSILNFIHRCYVIWQSRIMMYLLAFLAVVLNGIELGCDIAGTVGASSPSTPVSLTNSRLKGV